MNISATHLSNTVSSANTHKVETLTPAALNKSSGMNKLAATPDAYISQQSNISAPVSTSINPTYERPISKNFVSINTANQPIDSKQSNNNDQPDQINPSLKPSSQELQPEKLQPEQQKPVENYNVNEVYSEAELEVISTLQSLDTEVSAHEQAHSAVGGEHAGSPSYSYQTGPDGKKYAVSGEVSISTSEIQGDPRATLEKAQQIKAAALAPLEPSSQDRKVAAKADQMAHQARNEIVESDNETKNTTSSLKKNNDSTSFIDSLDMPKNINLNVDTQQKMNERNLNINNVYQNSAMISTNLGFEIQV